VLKACIADALGHCPPMYLAKQYSRLKRESKLPDEYVVLLGHNSGREIAVSNPGVIEFRTSKVTRMPIYAI